MLKVLAQRNLKSSESISMYNISQDKEDKFSLPCFTKPYIPPILAVYITAHLVLFLVLRDGRLYEMARAQKLMVYLSSALSLLCSYAIISACIGIGCVVCTVLLYRCVRVAAPWYMFLKRAQKIGWMVILTASTSCVLGVFLVYQTCVRQHVLQHISARNELTCMCIADSRSVFHSYVTPAKIFVNDSYMGTCELISKEALELYSTYTVQGQFKAYTSDTNKLSTCAQGILGSVTIGRVHHVQKPVGLYGLASFIRLQCMNMLKRSTPEHSALMLASICGHKEPMHQLGMTDLFRVCGISHVVCVSGTHLALFSLLIAKILSHIPLSLFTQRILTLCLSMVFVMSCGMPLSALRAWGLVACSVFADFFRAQRHVISTVSCTALVMIALNPWCACDVSFILSVSCVIGLALFGNYVNFLVEWAYVKLLRTLLYVCAHSKGYLKRVLELLIHTIQAKALTSVLQVASVSLCAQLSTLPFSIGFFQGVSFIAVLSNVLLVPCMVYTALLAVITIMCAPCAPVSELLLCAGSYATSAILLVLKIFSKFPIAYVSTDGLSAGLAFSVAVFLVVIAYKWPRPGTHDVY